MSVSAGAARRAMSPPPEVVSAVSAGFAGAPKTLPPWLFYDERGSAWFEAITELPEYYLTRAEREIFATQGPAILAAAAIAPATRIVELGAGTATKTELLLAHLVQTQGAARYLPIDVSASALAECAARLARTLPALVVEPWALSSEAALARLRDEPGPACVLFIGSSLGNYDGPAAHALLRQIRAAIAPGDALILGTDLRKDPEVMRAAYDDAAGVTAAFNKNVLVRLNRELGAEFCVERFRHVALWNAARSRIEMHLESVGPQRVPIPALGVEVAFADGERIHTESSVKYDAAMVRDLLTDAGFRLTRTFFDGAEQFGVHVARAA